MTKRQKKKEFSRFLFAMVSLLATIMVLYSMIRTTQYGLIIYDMNYIEEVATGGWTEELTKAYNEGLCAKEKLVTRSDFVSFVYHSGYSIIGKSLRIIVFAVLFLLLATAVLYLFNYTKHLIRLFRYLKRKSWRI